MPTAFNIHKVTTFPATPAADTVYVKQTGTRCEIKVTDSSGVYFDNEQDIAAVLNKGSLATANIQLENPAVAGTKTLLVNGNAGSYGIGDMDGGNNGTYIGIDDANEDVYIGNVKDGTGKVMLIDDATGVLRKATFDSMLPVLGAGKIAYGDANGAITSSSGIAVSGTAKVVLTDNASGADNGLYVNYKDWSGTVDNYFQVRRVGTTLGDATKGDMILTTNASANIHANTSVKIQSGWPITTRIEIASNGDIKLPGLTNSTDKLLSTDNTGKLKLVNAPVLASGLYTPTTSNLTNMSSVSIGAWTYSRVGSIVTVAGMLTCSITTAGGTLTSVDLSLPVVPASSAIINGSGTCGSIPVQVGLGAGGTNAKIVFSASFANGASISAIFQYEIN